MATFSWSDTRVVAAMAWPTTLAMTVRSLYRLNDQYFVQELGVTAQSAIAVGSMVAIWFFAFGELVGVGNLAIAARRLGQGRESDAHAVVRTSLRLAVGIGIALTLLTVVGREALAAVLVPGAEPEQAREREQLADYLLWLGVGQPLLCLMPPIDSSFMAKKLPRVPLLLESIAVLGNAVGNAILVPRYGVAGAGIATALSRAIPVVLGVVLLRRAAGIERPVRGHATWSLAGRIARIGVPTCIAIAMYSGVYQVMLAWTFPRFGAAGRSALGPGFGIESVFFCAYWGVAVAVAALVGRALGEGRPDRAAAVARTAVWMNLGIGLFSSAVFVAFGDPLVRLLADAPDAIAANVDYLHALAWAQPIQAVGIIFEQVLIGAGLTAPIMVSTGVMNLARIPLAHGIAVGLGFGLHGIWWAINVSTAGKATWAWLLYRRGRWRRHEV